jgi:protein ImuB
MSRAEEQTTEISRLLAILHKWGVHTLGDLAALPRNGLAARLGPEAARLWEQASGKSTRLLRLIRPPEIFLEQIEFEHEIETAEPLLFVLRRFLELLTRRLGLLYLVAEELAIRLRFADKSEYQHRFQIPEPTNSVELLFRLLQTHLENFRTEHPIIGVALEMQPARPGQQQFQFFETPLRDPSRLHETLNRLTGLLGRERVGRPVLEDSHRPDAFHLEPFAWKRPEPQAHWPNEQRTGPALRRCRLKPSSPPVAVAAVYDRRGPYLASGDWWDKKRWERVEWDLELAGGMICRVREENADHQLEGIYD